MGITSFSHSWKYGGRRTISSEKVNAINNWAEVNYIINAASFEIRSEALQLVLQEMEYYIIF